MDVLEFLTQKVKARTKTIVFPEGENPAIIQAARQLQSAKLVKPLLLGNPERIMEIGQSLNEDLSQISILEPNLDSRLNAYTAYLSKERTLPENACRRIVCNPLYFGAMLVKKDEAHGMIAGINHSTGEVIVACEMIIGLKTGIGLPSSFYLMDIPGYRGSQGGLLIFADPAINPDPTPEDLAHIAVSTAESARELLGWEPRVALLSFSTKGSAGHECVEKVTKAVELARTKSPDILLDGEMQADSALVEAIARKKMGKTGPVAGRANILIFPNLDAANIAAKLVQQLAKAKSYGPSLQGFSRPVSDLSRGATVCNIINTALFVAAAN